MKAMHANLAGLCYAAVGVAAAMLASPARVQACSGCGEPATLWPKDGGSMPANSPGIVYYQQASDAGGGGEPPGDRVEFVEAASGEPVPFSIDRNSWRHMFVIVPNEPL